MNTTSTASLGEDARLTEAGSEGKAQAWLWWTTVPDKIGEKLGVIGNFSAESPAAAAAVLRAAEDRLRAQGCTLAVGPMDGTTWRRYRFVTDAGTEPPFFLEPAQPPEWPEWWREAGFVPLAEYYSTATENLAQRDDRLDGVATRMRASGISIRPIDAENYEVELGRIYDVSIISFQSNFLYTPLPREAFIAQYLPLRSKMKPELVLLAEQNGRPVGYVFATPDFAQAQRGQPITNFIVKTLAVLPGRAFAGLGALLLGEVHAAAHRAGFKRGIHALMHETNTSRNLSAHYAQTIRRYTLFSKRVGP
jgi:GNAT superfamily N-acetyltransferase